MKLLVLVFFLFVGGGVLAHDVPNWIVTLDKPKTIGREFVLRVNGIEIARDKLRGNSYNIGGLYQDKTVMVRCAEESRRGWITAEGGRICKAYIEGVIVDAFLSP